MTDKPARAKADALEIVREMTRRAGHEIRNALNGVAVNVEVVRSRVAREGSTTEVASFAERASSQIEEASALTEGLLALVGNVLAAEAQGTLGSGPGTGGGSRLVLMIYGDRAAVFMSDIKRLAGRIGVTVELHAERVILTLSPEGKDHSKI